MNAIAVFFALVVATLARNNHSRRQAPQGYLPRCRFDENILKNHELFAEKIKGAHVVFTGKVASEVVVANGTMKFRVVVRRYFKNVIGLPKSKEVKVLKIPNDSDGEGVKCRQPVRMRYTAIFVGRKAQNIHGVDVVLIMSPISVTLNHLDRVSEATKDITFQREDETSIGMKTYSQDRTGTPEHKDLMQKPRHNPIEGPDNYYGMVHTMSLPNYPEPCEETFCAWGAHCINGPDGRALCQCPTMCKQKTDPVCGTDGKTYANHCQLRVASCKARLNTRVHHQGECEQSDPCRSKQCGWGSQCVVSSDGRNASCTCPDKCPGYGDHDASRPVCGSDAVDYANLCELRRAACTQNTNITVKFAGKCDPCAGVQCAEPEVCQLDEQRNPVCRCGDTCPLEFTPVCGSDGKTYSNECTLRQEACRARKTLNIIYRGKCSSGINPCMSVRCTMGEECAINKFGIAHCQCPSSCEPVMRPVCSKDGRTFPSECELRRAACSGRSNIEIAYAGVCGEKGPCTDHNCQFGATCVERSGTAHCECPHCSAEFQPVCGSDGISYGNECKLKLEACKHRREITVLYEGPCNGCENKKCDFYSVCESDGATEGRCVCPQTCSDAKLTNGTVCGTDGVTYGNECELRLNSCKTKQYVLLAYKGNCDMCQGVECKYGSRCEAGECVCPTDCAGSGDEPVCASNMMTYPNECELQKSMCLQPSNLPPLSVVFYGDCRERFPVAGTLSNQNFIEKKSCEDSWYGCCPDGKNPAQGPNFAGCPSQCGCNKLGSYSETCDPETQQCKCRPGVGGAKCDRCESGFWGLPKISSGYRGCIPCGCSVFGSVRDDCEQMTGRCVCRPGVQGQKCTVCTSHNKILGPNGCVSADVTTSPPTTCKELTCYFGATCIERGGLAVCECHTKCTEDNEPQVVCGSDGQTYKSPCDLRQLACRLQKDIVVQAFGACKDEMFSSTDWPVRRYTPLQFTQPDESNSPLSKSTRHLLVPEPDPRYYYERSGNSARPLAPVSIPDQKSGELGISGGPQEGAEVDVLPPGANIVYHTRGGDFASAFRPTPATVRVVTDLLGDLCSENSDCRILYSHCVKGACTCLPEHSESSDRRECIANPSSPDEYRACASSPCHEASTCVDFPGTTFACMCSPNFTGVFCEIEISEKFTTPAFHGRSYARLKPLKAYYKLSVEIEFKSYTEDGILLYNQQKADGLGDYVSLAIVKGFVEFRYDLGSGPAVIRSLEKIQTGKFHKAVIKRYHRDGMLKVDDGEDMGGQASGHSKALDLQEDTFIGYIPTNYTRIYENIGTNKGLQGCIRKLKLGRQEVGLNSHQHDWVLKTEGIYDCSQHACTTSPCQNKGRCFEMGDLFTCACAPHYQGEVCEKTDDPCASNPCHSRSKCTPYLGSFVCDCLPGTFGKNCEIEYKEVGIVTPEFNGSSYIQFPRLEGIKKTFSVEVSFMPKAPNGLIFYSGQMKNGKGDFISLNLARGHLQFRFNLGSGIANITSRESLTLNKWHWVRVYREGREGILQVDNASIVRGYSGTPLTELNLQTPFFIGSLSNWKQIHRLSGATKGFKGAIQRVILNGHLLPISNSLPNCNLRTSFNSTGCGVNIGYYDGLPCSVSKNPCQNNGVCIPDLEDFTCKCPSNFKGKYCEMVDEDNLALKFNGLTFLQYRNRGYRSENASFEFEDIEEQYNRTSDEDENNIEYYEDVDFEIDDFDFSRKPERGNRYELRIRTFVPDGLLLWRSKNRNMAEDYLSVAIVDGYPEFSFNLGLRNTFWAIRSKIRVDDGEWHTIQVRRRKRVGFISVDGHPSIKGIARTGAISLRTNSKLWIGGAAVLPPNLPSAYYKGFDGCIKQILVNAKPLDLLANNDLSKIHFCHDNEI